MGTHNCRDCHVKSAAARHLSNDECCLLENNSVNVSFKKGEIIIKQNALSLNVAYLHSGMVKIHMDGPAHDKILRVVKAPKYLGLPTNFGDKINHFSVTALEDTKVCFIDLSVFRNLILQNNKFAYELIVELCTDELNDYQRFASIAQKQVPGLVAETLLCFSQKLYQSPTFNIPLTRGEMGDLIGTSRESVSRVISDMCNDNIIHIEKNTLTIIDMDSLREISDKG